MIELFLHQAAGNGRQQMRDGFGRGMGTVGAGEGVVHIDVAELGESTGEGLVIRFFSVVVAQIFQQQYVAVFEGSDRILGCLANTIIGEGDPATECLGDRFDQGASATSRRRACPSAGRNATR